MKFVVDVQEIWTRSIIVEADSEDEARDKANKVIESKPNAGEKFQYSSTSDLEDWNVERVPDEAFVTDVG